MSDIRGNYSSSEARERWQERWHKLRKEEEERQEATKAEGDDRAVADMLAWIKYLTLCSKELRVYKLSPKQRKLLPGRLRRLRKELLLLRESLTEIREETAV